jgi:uncharacterized protein YraI
MIRLRIWIILLLGLALAGLLLLQPSFVQAGPLAQIPTGSIPTVTSTAAEGVATVLMEQEKVNVRSGPSSYDYPIIGVLIAGQQVPALGRTQGGDWIQIAYPGVPGGVAWVWSALIDVKGNLPMVEAPPTPTPQTTPTVDPTLASQFIVEIPPTRLPTFTAPPPLVYPTFPAVQSGAAAGRVPMGLVIIGMGVIGLFGAMISFLRGR